MSKIKEWHHGYLGMIFMLAGFIFILLGIWIVLAMILIIGGFLIFIDDVYQHITQLIHPEYLSPLHRAFYWLKAKIINWWSSQKKLSVPHDKRFWKD